MQTTLQKPTQNLQYNNINTPFIIEIIRRVGDLGNIYDSKEFAEKGAQPVKNEFARNKEKFTSNLIEKLCCNKILNHLVNNKKCNSSLKCDLSNYHMKSTKFLNEKLIRGLPIPFILNKNEEYLF